MHKSFILCPLCPPSYSSSKWEKETKKNCKKTLSIYLNSLPLSMSLHLYHSFMFWSKFFSFPPNKVGQFPENYKLEKSKKSLFRFVFSPFQKSSFSFSCFFAFAENPLIFFPIIFPPYYHEDVDVSVCQTWEKTKVHK